MKWKKRYKNAYDGEMPEAFYDNKRTKP